MSVRKARVLAIDAGGTMTDTFIVDDAGAFVVDKAQTTPEDESAGFMASGDPYHSVMKGAARLGDPLERPVAAVEADEDFTFDATTPTLAAERRARPGKITPQQSAAEFLAASEVERIEPPTLAGRPLEPETLAALYDERLSRREVRDIQSGYKDPDRFEKWIALLQQRVDWDDPIVLPLGEGLNVVRRGSDRELVVRSDAGHDFCGFDENWKAYAPVFVRDTDELLREIYPRMGHCDPEWMELREFYCPRSGRLLETEAVTPGYPVVHDFLPDIEGFYRGWLGREVP
jgi:acetone carboxylase gamma subunit